MVFFDVLLRPYRSLPPRGFALVMAVLGGASFLISLSFVLRGAWPVCGFFGLDVLLVYIAFRASYRSARQTEHVQLTEDRLEVERISVRGERRLWKFEPFWLRVQLDEIDEDSNRLLLTSHGRSLALGSFLGPVQRRALASDLRTALQRWRRFISNGSAEPTS